jgi:hypothetical protein
LTATSGQRQGASVLLVRRLLGGASHLGQVWFRAAVLEPYRQRAGFRVIRTNTVGRVRGPQWMLDFGIAGEGDAYIHASIGELASRLPESEWEHWARHVATLPLSANYTMMQLTRGACLDDGDVRSW